MTRRYSDRGRKAESDRGRGKREGAGARDIWRGKREAKARDQLAWFLSASFVPPHLYFSECSIIFNRRSSSLRFIYSLKGQCHEMLTP